MSSRRARGVVGAALTLLGIAASAAPGQTVAVGVQGALADYREVSADLHFRGPGFAGTAAIALHKLTADVVVTRISFDTVAGGSASQNFTATQVDARVRWYLTSGLDVEVGVTHRTIDPEFAAQSMGAVLVGARGTYALGPGASLMLRGNYLAGTSFSGGGSAPFGLDVGLGVSVGSATGTFRVTGNYDFERIDRKTSPNGVQLSAPIQMALARLGVAVGF